MDESGGIAQITAMDSREAFAVTVREHANLVYSAARRQLGDSALVEDVVQAVFILLWRKAGRVRRPVAGWLVKATYFACRDAKRVSGRRLFHERAAAMMKSELSEPGEEMDWEEYAGAVDAAMVRLGGSDRDAISLRYLRGLSFKSVGEAMGIGEEAAKKRVGRAIERLREALTKESSTPTAEILATQLGLHGIEVAPGELVTSITATAGLGGHGPMVASIVWRAAMRSVRTKLTVAAIILILLGLFGAVYVAMQMGSGDGGAVNAPVAGNQAVGEPAQPIVLEVDAMIDGGDTLNIGSGGATWVHNTFKWPTRIRINGADFDPHVGAALEKIGLGEADLSSAEVLGRKGRCTVAMEKTDGGIAVHFTDPLAGAGPYWIKIGFERKSGAQKVVAATLPSDAVYLDVKATIGGSDVLTITPEAMEWRHVADWLPSNVVVDGKPWNMRTPLGLESLGLAGVDLSSAQVVEKSGRDTVVMEPGSKKVVIYLADSVGSPGDYEIKIRFAKLK
jgi:RNA polymerase sigma factor (sigma-70 family)